MATTAKVSLERALSKLGLASRSEARQLIADGRVHVDGRVITNPLARVVPERLDVRIDGVARERHPRIAAGPVVLAAADVVTLFFYFGLGSRFLGA